MDFSLKQAVPVRDGSGYPTGLRSWCAPELHATAGALQGRKSTLQRPRSSSEQPVNGQKSTKKVGDQRGALGYFCAPSFSKNWS